MKKSERASERAREREGRKSKKKRRKKKKYFIGIERFDFFSIAIDTIR